MSEETEPQWLVTVHVDPDDSVPVETKNVEAELKIALKRMKIDGEIFGFTIERRGK